MKSQRGNTNQIVKDGMNIVINEIIKQIERINNNLYQNVDFYVRVCVCVCVCVLVCVNGKVNLFVTKDKRIQKISGNINKIHETG